MAERFGEPDVDAFMERISPEQFFEWQAEFLLRQDEAKQDALVQDVQHRMSRRVGV